VRIGAFEHTDRYQGDPSEVADVGDRTGIQVDGVALGFEESVTVRVLHGGFPYCLNKRGGPAFCRLPIGFCGLAEHLVQGVHQGFSFHVPRETYKVILA